MHQPEIGTLFFTKHLVPKLQSGKYILVNMFGLVCGRESLIMHNHIHLFVTSTLI